MKEHLSNIIVRYLEGFSVDEIKSLLEVPPTPEMGDFALPCFGLAKKMKKPPMQIAQELKCKMEQEKADSMLSHIEAANAYLNFYMDRKEYMNRILLAASQTGYGTGNEGAGKVICMDYSSPNIAKNFHVGHLRTTIIGNSLYKIYDMLGYHVIRINHLGDWGTQFGKLIVAYHKWSSKEQIDEKGIEELLRIYVMFNQEAERDPQLDDQARSWFARMEKGDPEALEIWEWFKEISMAEFEQIYQLLGVTFDYYTGESFYMDKVPEVMEELKEKGLLEENQGTNIVSLEKYDMPPCLITKKDGSTIYHSRDIAAALYRRNEYHFHKCLYVTGVEQKLHFAQVFKVIELMGYEWHQGLVHVPYGLVSLEGAKLSTRTGNIIYAKDILKEAMKRSEKIIEQKSPTLENKEITAQMVGIGAVIFHDLYNQRIKNIDFSWDEVLNFDGATGPYVQYTYARAKSVLRKADGKTGKDINAGLLKTETEYQLIKTIALYPDKIREAAIRYEPFILARYVIDLTSAFNKFYQECPVLRAEWELQEIRLLLVELSRKIIKEAMMLLGIDCPEEM